MVHAVWVWKNDIQSNFFAAQVVYDGSLVVAGNEESYNTTEYEFDALVAYKIDPSNRTVVWKWKEDMNDFERGILGAATGTNGSIILVGYMYGNWSAPDLSGIRKDCLAIKLNAEGQMVWKMQGEFGEDSSFKAVATGEDNCTFMGGMVMDRFLLVKVDDEGNALWNWTGNSTHSCEGNGVAVTENNSVVLVGYTEGRFANQSIGEGDFAAVKIDSDGHEVWRWQDGTEREDHLTSVVAGDNGSVIMSGHTRGVFYGGINVGYEDVVAIKLDRNGTELWRWQDGTTKWDIVEGSTMGDDGFVIMVGVTRANWARLYTGSGTDFMAVCLDASNGTYEAWRWQGDASYADELYAAATGSNDTAFLVGQFAGVLDAEGIVLDSVRRGLVVVLNTTSAVPTFDEYLLELSSIASKPSTPSRLVIDLIALSAVAVVVLLMALIDRRRKSQAAMRASNRQEQESPDGNLGPDEGNAATEPAPVPEE